ncbi:golvesin C-terminal-like domain-containing protein [Actinoplanes sp. RD1]|uniref:golvesin C-terminal-like domain-containing protein n=1 Tax=Actinoplanes sp. RD1 TaxID=3064538 RepID=UPI002740C072|nr:polymorphic toxin-type HINT domain-containing protein [Actinoplanes sp. RD1]
MGLYRKIIAFATIPVTVAALGSHPRAVSAAPAAPARAPAGDVRPAAASCAPGTTPVAAVLRQAPAARALRVAATAATAPAYSAPDAPRRMIPGDEYLVRVTVVNPTAQVLPAATYVLSYRWALADGKDATENGNRLETALPADLAPGASVTVDARVKAPERADIGNSREQFLLRWDLRDRIARTWLSDTAGVPFLEQPVTVEHPTSDQLGLENFYHYAGGGTGAGSQLLVNQFSGNAVFDYAPISNPSRGLATFVRLAYNSQDSSNSYLGYGWSLSTSTLHRLGSPLQFDGPGDKPAQVTLVDGDGTGHIFERNAAGGYDSPAGVNLLLQRTTGTDDARRWSITSPDRTTMFFDARGQQSVSVDRNGNELTFHYVQGVINNRTTAVLTHLTDATGRRTLTLDYYQPGDSYSYFDGTVKKSATSLANAAITYQLRSVTDVSGRTITFTYTTEGQLAEVIDGAGSNEPKAFGFFYDATQGERNTKLVRVVDPNGNASNVRYHGATSDEFHRWRVERFGDRLDRGTTFAYADADGAAGSRVTTVVTDANGHATTSGLDGFGRADKLVNAKGETTEMVWDADNNVVRLREDNQALSTWVYDPKTGYPLEIRDAEANARDLPPARLEYRTELNGFVADLTGKVSPAGRRWQFVHDDRGNLVAVTDPKGTATAQDGDFTSRYAYDELGHLVRTTDANGHTTEYADYDANGYPRRITDALGCASFFTYDAAGNTTSTVDARRITRTFTYDIFKRPLLTRVPKDQAAGQVIVTPGPKYDANDNIIQLTSANGAVTTARYDERDQVVSVSAPKDTPGGPAKTSTSVYDPVGNLIRQTEAKGTLTTGDDNDFVTTYRYDEVDQLIESVDADGGRSTATYDRVGNLLTVTDPKRNATADPDDVTSRYTYDLNRRVTAVTDAAGHTARTAYDNDGLVVSTTDEENNTSTVVLDERGMQSEVRSVHAGGRVFTTRYLYDQVGNPIRTETPRGVETTDDPHDFAQSYVYDAVNRLVEEHLPFDTGDTGVGTPDKIFYGYDEIGQLTEVSNPPSDGQSVRTVTRNAYYDNGWLRRSTDPFGITANYDYNAVGEQTNRTLISAGGASTRTMTWDYFPDGKVRSRSDDGIPVGQHAVLVDNSDPNDTEAAGAWDTLTSDTGYEGFDYRVAAAGAQSYSWKADIPADGTYEVFVRSPRGTATDAKYTVEHNGGSTERTVDQSQHGGAWVSLGRYAFTEDNRRTITLSAQADGPVVADAVRLIRDNSGEADTEKKTFTHEYDPNGNLTALLDTSSGARVDRYAVAYDELNRATSVEERDGGTVRNTTRYSYDPNGNLLDWRHDDQRATFAYDDPRDLVTKVVNAAADGGDARTSTFDYTARGHIRRQVKPNGNTVDFTYYADGLLRTQVEKKSGGTVVNQHELEYNANSHKTRDTAHVQNADNKSAFLDNVFTYDYDPRDRIRKVTKTGNDASAETYEHDANSNVIRQVVEDKTSTFRYDRNRLASSTADGETFQYAYDPFGRLSKVSSGGEQTERHVYDGFDRVSEHRQGTGAAAVTTRYAYDPLDRTVTRTSKAGSGDAKTTQLDYLGLSEQVLTERVDGDVRKSYQYSPLGELLSQISTPATGEREQSYYGYNTKSDVESLTDEDGDNRSTYGYTAYGSDDTASFTGVDKPDPANPDAEPDNVYRFNTKRLDPASGTYDMGFRDYSPAQNRFLTLDLYNGALADLSLSTNPYTMNRYSFGGGNPISMIDLDGHWPSWSDIGHGALDVVGLVPVVGEVADLANGAWYAAEGNYVDAALSFSSAIPLVGYGATAVKAGKYAAKGIDAVQTGTKAVDDVATAGRKAPDVAPPPAKTGPDVPAAPGKPAGGAPAGGAPPAKTGGAPPAPKQPAAPAAPPKAPEAPKAPDAAGGASCPLPNSFAPGTAVVLADGTSKPIEQIRTGDKVLSTDPVTGRTEARAVTATITGQGVKKLVEVAIDTDGARGPAVATVIATAGHPFWVDDQGRWVDAGDLARGDWTRTGRGDMARVVSIREWTAPQRVHNLTVDGLHTYYVLAGDTPVLVHNANPARKCELLSPGPFAQASVPASRFGQVTDAEQRVINVLGDLFGCHHCGARVSGLPNGNWIGDHMPVTSLVRPGTPQRLFPHCDACRASQGGVASQVVQGRAPGMRRLPSGLYVPRR